MWCACLLGRLWRVGCANTGMVEVWLQRLVEGMQGTVKAIVKRAARNVAEMGLQDFIFSHPAQVALLGLQFQWTAETQVRACVRAQGLHSHGMQIRQGHPRPLLHGMISCWRIAVRSVLYYHC